MLVHFLKMVTSTIIVASGCKFACKSYTIKHKQITICAVLAMISVGSSILSACHLAMVKRHQFYRWKRVVQGEKDIHPKIAKAIRAILVSVMTAPSDENPNSGNTITGLGAAVLSTKLLHGNLQCCNHGKMSILAYEGGIVAISF